MITPTPRPELQRRAARHYKAASELLTSLGYQDAAKRLVASPGATYDLLRYVHAKECERLGGIFAPTDRFLATVLIP